MFLKSWFFMHRIFIREWEGERTRRRRWRWRKRRKRNDAGCDWMWFYFIFYSHWTSFALFFLLHFYFLPLFIHPTLSGFDWRSNWSLNWPFNCSCRCNWLTIPLYLCYSLVVLSLSLFFYLSIALNAFFCKTFGWIL